jgi:capsular exopolysaccharide synthesis family protein
MADGLGDLDPSTTRLQLDPIAGVEPVYRTGGDDTPLVDRARVLYKRRWTLATVFVLVMLIVVADTFTQSPVYVARAQLLIESADPNVVTFKGVIDEAKTFDYYQTQYRLLQSRTLARKAIDDLRLWDRPDFGGSSRRFSLYSLLGSAVRRKSSSPSAGETRSQAATIDAFLNGLTIAPVRLSRLADVRYESPDPELAANAANALARAYIAQNLEYRFSASKEASDFLAQQLGEQRKKMEGSENLLQQYREQNDAVSLEDRQNIQVQKLAELSGVVTRAKTIRIQKEALYNQLRSMQSDRAALDAIPEILANGFVQQLRAQLADLHRQKAQLGERVLDQHPDMVAITTAIQTTETRLQGEIGKVLESIKNDYLAAAAQERSLTQALDTQKSEIQAMNRKSIDYNVLQRDAQSNRQLYDSLLQRANETGVSSELRTSNVRIVDRAEVPTSPDRPAKTFNLLVGAVLGLFGGIVLAVFFEYVDSRIKKPDDIKSALGLPFLGMIPAVSRKDAVSKCPMINDGVPPGFLEAFRSIRTNVVFSSVTDGCRSVVITSTGANEGKTSVAVNLAIAVAQAGQRVLVIDADMRRPDVHTIFGQPQEPGLSNLLAATTKASESVRHTNVPGLWALSAGRLPPNPAELLGSPRMKEFIATLAGHFDWVIIDTPPIMAVTDAAVIGHLATGAIFVVGAEMTTRQAASAAIERLQSAQVRLIGGILNRVDLERDAYYYSKYYRREYTHYYTKNEVARVG